MRLPLFITFFLLTLSSLFAQNIQVLQEGTNEPVQGATLYNNDRSKTGITDFDGFVDITKFTSSETINIHDIAHKDLTTTKGNIVANGNKVYMVLAENALDEIVLSVSKFGQSRKDIPQKIVSVTSEDVSFYNPQTSADLLENSGQVFVQRSQLGGGSPLIRGFSTNRLLITVDGVRFNNAIFRGGNVQNVISIDPFSVDRTEVILGPGSVVYGSDAVGGVMNFYTMKPRFSFEKGLAIHGNASARYSTANNEKTGHFDINFGMKEWAFLTSVSYSDFDDLRMGSNGPDDYLRPDFVETINGVDTVVTNPDPEVQVGTGYDQINFMQKVRYMPSERWDFDLGLFYTTTSDYPRYDRLIRRLDGELRSAEWFYGPQRWLSGNLQITNKPAGIAETDPLTGSNRAIGKGIYDESKLTLSYQQFEESRNDRDFGDTTLFEMDEKVDAYSVGWDATKKLGKTNLFYGLEYVNNKVNSIGKQTDITTGVTIPDASRYPDGAIWQSFAVYTSLQSKLAENLSFQGGIRYNHILVDAEFTDEFFDFPFTEANINTGALTFGAGIDWQASDMLDWRLNLGSAFRAPNIDDVGKIFDSEPGSVVVPNPDLKHEYAYNVEVGVNFNFENVVRIDLATYYTLLNDALVRRDFTLNGQDTIIFQGEESQVQAIQNAGEARVNGFEAGLEVNFCKFLQLTSQYNITDGFTIEDDGSRAPIRHAPPQFGNAHLIYNKKNLRLDAFVEYNGQFDFEDLAPSQQNNAFLYALDENGNPFSPSWYTVNFGAQYQLTSALRLNASLENITDQRYRQYSSGIAAPGRNLIVAASYKF